MGMGMGVGMCMYVERKRRESMEYVYGSESITGYNEL